MLDLVHCKGYVEADDKRETSVVTFEAWLTFRMFCKAEKSKFPMPGIPGMPPGGPPPLSFAIVDKCYAPK